MPRHRSKMRPNYTPWITAHQETRLMCVTPWHGDGCVTTQGLDQSVRSCANVAGADVDVPHGAVADDAVADVAVADVAVVADGAVDPDEDDWPMLAYVFPENATAALASHGAPSMPITPPDTMDTVDIVDVAPGHGKASGGDPGGGGGADGFITIWPDWSMRRYFW